MFAALLDTSVLWPSLQRDFLLSLAVEGWYRPLWSTRILDELCYHEAKKLISCGHNRALAARQAQHLVDRMSSVFPDVAHRAVSAMASRFVRPPSSVDQILDHLMVRYAMKEAVDLIRDVM